jgi:protein-S-isoprenylcysteine O-methyltransferase Ste14
VAFGLLRIRVEEKPLREGLRDYGGYARHVRWRFTSLIW